MPFGSLIPITPSGGPSSASRIAYVRSLPCAHVCDVCPREHRGGLSPHEHSGGLSPASTAASGKAYGCDDTRNFL